MTTTAMATTKPTATEPSQLKYAKVSLGPAVESPDRTAQPGNASGVDVQS